MSVIKGCSFPVRVSSDPVILMPNKKKADKNAQTHKKKAMPLLQMLNAKTQILFEKIKHPQTPSYKSNINMTRHEELNTGFG